VAHEVQGLGSGVAVAWVERLLMAEALDQVTGEAGDVPPGEGWEHPADGEFVPARLRYPEGDQSLERVDEPPVASAAVPEPDGGGGRTQREREPVGAVVEIVGQPPQEDHAGRAEHGCPKGFAEARPGVVPDQLDDRVDQRHNGEGSCSASQRRTAACSMGASGEEQGRGFIKDFDEIACQAF